MWDHLDTLDPRWFASHRYALVDASWRDELPAAWPVVMVAPTFLGRDTARCPVLLELPALPAREQRVLMDRLSQEVVDRHEALCSLLLACSAPADQLARHLAQRMVLHVPGSASPKQFRYFDPGTFLQLPLLLQPAGMAWLLGPASSVLVPWAGQWSRYDRPVQTGAFRMLPSHLQALSRIGVVNRALMQRQQPADAADWLRDCARLDAIVVRAIERHALLRQSDLVSFALHALQHHPCFDDHPRLQALLARLRTATPADELDYQEVTAVLSPQDWQAICHDPRSAGSIPSDCSEGAAP